MFQINDVSVEIVPEAQLSQLFETARAVTIYRHVVTPVQGNQQLLIFCSLKSHKCQHKLYDSHVVSRSWEFHWHVFCVYPVRDWCLWWTVDHFYEIVKVVVNAQFTSHRSLLIYIKSTISDWLEPMKISNAILRSVSIQLLIKEALLKLD